MIAWLMALAVSGLDPQGAAPAAAPELDSRIAWARSIRTGTWGAGLVENDGADVIFTKPALSGPGPTRRLWLRREVRDPQILSYMKDMGGGYSEASSFKFLEEIILEEFNCQTGQARAIQTNAYAEHNAQGATVAQTAEGEVWEYPLPDTIGDTGIKLACSGALTSMPPPAKAAPGGTRRGRDRPDARPPGPTN